MISLDALPLVWWRMILVVIVLALLEVMETFYIDLGDTKYRPAHLLRKMVAAGYLGRKSGAGFYVYEEGKKAGVNPVLVKG